MAHTSEQRDHLSTPLCGAKKRDGSRCRAFAGQGTSHRGTGRCKYHGGSTPNHVQSAVIAEAKRNMVKLGEPIPDIAPADALLGMLRATTGHVAWLHREVAALDELASHEGRVMVDLYDSERDRLTRIAKACLDAGVSEAEVQLSNAMADTFARAVDSALRSVGGLAEDQRRKFAEVLRLELAMIERSGLDEQRAPGAIYGGRPASAS